MIPKKVTKFKIIYSNSIFFIYFHYAVAYVQINKRFNRQSQYALKCKEWIKSIDLAAVLRVSFFELFKYKLERNGGKLIRVDPKYTSQTCSCCGHISKENRLTQAKFVCVSCNTEFNVDYNASVNIFNTAGTAVKAS